jgi:hypothetical protein
LTQGPAQGVQGLIAQAHHPNFNLFQLLFNHQKCHHQRPAIAQKGKNSLLRNALVFLMPVTLKKSTLVLLNLPKTGF